MTDRGKEAPGQSELRTFLIADMRGYTRFTEERGDEAAALLTARFADLAENMIAEYHGRLLELRGDEALAVFTSARQALRAAVALQERLQEETKVDSTLPLHAGIGLDAGDAIPVREGYRTGALNLASRLCGLAGPGEVLCSEQVVHLARKIEGLMWINRGDVALKGLQKTVQVMQVGREGSLDPMKPPLQHRVAGLPGNLPDESTSFIGRQRETVSLSELMQRPNVRLVTVTGPGGTGKTRLALHVADTLIHRYSDGVFFVSLAPVMDSELVLSAIASTLDIKESDGRSLLETVVDRVREAHLLLVLDNFEHVLDASGTLGALLDRCHQLEMMVTSRTLLNLSREHAFDVPPLSFPDASTIHTTSRSPRDLPSRYESVALFAERARAARSDFEVNADNAAAVAEICYRLDGLPLAIELAAARIRLFPPHALLARLARRLQILTGGSRDAPSRQQTLRATIDWSYSLLNEEQKHIFARLAVFAGGCSIDAVEDVCSDGSDDNIVDAVAAIAEQSLLRQEGESEQRFTMLQTIQDYAWERLLEADVVDELRQRHAYHFLALAEQAEPELRGANQGLWLNRLEVEHDNLRAALAWLHERGDVEHALRLVGALWRFWWMHGHLSEGRDWLNSMLAMPGTAEPSIRAAALHGAGGLTWSQGDYDRAEALYHECLAIRRELADKSGIALTLNNLGAVAHSRKKYDEAVYLYEESLSIERELNQPWGLALVLGNLGYAVLMHGDYERAATLNEESLALWRKLGDRIYMSRTLNSLVAIALEQQNYERALVLQRESLSLARDMDNRENVTFCLEGLAKIATAQDYPERAALLWGAAEVLRETLGQPLSPDESAGRQGYLERMRLQADQSALLTAWNRGRSMSLHEAIACGLEEEDQSS